MDALTNDITKVHAAVKSELRKVLGNLAELNKTQEKDTEKKLGLPPLIPAPRNSRHDSLELLPEMRMEEQRLILVEKYGSVCDDYTNGKAVLERLNARREDIERKLQQTKLQMSRKILQMKEQR